MSDSQQSKKKMICLVLMGLVILTAVSVGMYFLYTKWYMKDKDGKSSTDVQTTTDSQASTDGQATAEKASSSLLGDQNGKNFCKKDEFISSELVNPFGSSAANKKKK